MSYGIGHPRTALLATPYDELPYERFPVHATHADHLITVARLFGLSPGSVQDCRVLELGCGSGANLVPMAAALPDGRYGGVDLSAVQIDEARAWTERLGLTNVTWWTGDLLELPEALGRFDVVIAHGVYSWVPPAVREGLLRVVRRTLAPDGVACVSHSVLPGAHARLALRDMLVWNDERSRPAAERAGDAAFFAATLCGHLADAGPLTPALRRVVGQLGGMSDATVVHDFLAEHNTPVTLTAFVDHAAREGLQFVADADVHTMWPPGVDEGTRSALSDLAGDPVALEQLLDFVTQRSFRTSVLCHADRTVNRSPGVEALRGLFVTSHARARGPEQGSWWFASEGRPAFGVRTPEVAAVLDVLEAAAPRPVSFDGLGSAEGLGEALLTLFRSDDIELSTGDRGVSGVDGEGFSVARDQLACGLGRVTNLWHRSVELDRGQRALLPLLDGSRDASALLAALGGTRDQGWLDTHLESLRRCGLLTSAV